MGIAIPGKTVFLTETAPSIPNQKAVIFNSLKWHQNECDAISNHRLLDCLLIHLFRHRTKKISKLHITGLCEWNPLVTGGFPSQRASNAENVSIWWCHHELTQTMGTHNWISCFWSLNPSNGHPDYIPHWIHIKLVLMVLNVSSYINLFLENEMVLMKDCLPWGFFNIEMTSYQCRNSLWALSKYKDRLSHVWSWDHLIFNMGIPIPVRGHIFIEMAPWYHNGLLFIMDVSIPGKIVSVLKWGPKSVWFNSGAPSDAIWCHKTWSTLVQVMAWWLMAPSHYLNQFCVIISTVT